MRAPDFPGLVLKPVPRCRGWFRGPVSDDWQQAKELAARLRALPAARGHGILVGLRGKDQGHRIYVTPPLSAREIVEAFRVGEQAGEQAILRNAERLQAAEQICPLIVTFADSHGLHAEFIRPLDEAAAGRIDALWSPDDAVFEGLEGYFSTWSGEGPLMVPRLIEEQGFQLWWD